MLDEYELCEKHTDECEHADEKWHIVLTVALTIHMIVWLQYAGHDEYPKADAECNENSGGGLPELCEYARILLHIISLSESRRYDLSPI